MAISHRCPDCGSVASVTGDLIPGKVVAGCLRCRQFAGLVDRVAPQWIPGGPDLYDRLVSSIREAEAVRAIVETDSEDPRWGATWSG